MPELMVIRHSRALANEKGILMGSKLDSPLSENGINLAKVKGRELLDQAYTPDRIFTSKLKRAIQTAEIILQELDVKTEIIQLENLNERDFGKYDNRPYKFVLEAFAKHGDNPPTIEQVIPFEKRVLSALERLKQESTGHTLVITHSNPVLVMQKAIFDPDNLGKFWEQGDPAYCEGFTYEF